MWAKEHYPVFFEKALLAFPNASSLEEVPHELLTPPEEPEEPEEPQENKCSCNEKVKKPFEQETL